MPEPRIAVLIPCRDEAASIGKVVRDFKHALPEATLWVYDNGSSDLTAERALEAGARVVFEPLPGKGNVVRSMLRDIEADYYLLVDGDDTYDAQAAPKLLAALEAANVDLAIACRTEPEQDAYRFGHRFGNRLIAKTLHLGHGKVRAPGSSRPLRDPLSGYRAMSRSFAKAFPARSAGFVIETEMNMFAISAGAGVAQLDAPYRARSEGSTSKLNTYRDGSKILLATGFSALARHPARCLAPVLALLTLALSLSPPPLKPSMAITGATLLALLLMLLPRAWDSKRRAQFALVRADQGSEEPHRSLFQRGLLLAVAFLLAILGFLAINTASVLSSTESLERSLKSSFVHPPNSKNWSHIHIPPEGFNDCLIPLMALLREPERTPAELIASASRVYKTSRPMRPCDALEQHLQNSSLDPETWVVTPYHSYWNGQRTLVHAAVPVLGVGGLRFVFASLSWFLILLGVGLQLRRVVRTRGDPSERNYHLAVLTLWLVFLCFFDLPDRARSFTAAPSNLLIFGLLHLLAVHPLSRFHGRDRLMLAVLLGAVMGYLALFFGTVLLPLLLFLVLAAFDGPSTARPAMTGAGTLALCTTYVGSVTASLIAHAAIAELAYQGSQWRQVADMMAFRLHGDGRTTLDPRLSGMFQEKEVALSDLLPRFVEYAHVLGFGNHTLGALILGLAIALNLGLLALVMYRLAAGTLARSGDRWRALALCAVGTAVLCWYGLFLEHTLTHARFMVRLVGFWVAAAALLPLLLGQLAPARVRTPQNR